MAHKQCHVKLTLNVNTRGIQWQYYLLTWFFHQHEECNVLWIKSKNKKPKPENHTKTHTPKKKKQKQKKKHKGRIEALLGHVGCIPQIPAPSLPPKGEIRLSLWCVRSLLMSLGINMQKRGLCGRESSEGKKRQSRIAALPGRTINLCLFQLRPWPKWCKIQAGMSSISVSSSVLFCAAWRLAMMYWFCQLCSVHSMLTWKGRVGLWREGLLVARLWLDFLSLPFSSLCSCNGLSFCLPSLPLCLTLNILSPHLSYFIQLHICIYMGAELHLSILISF